MRQSPLLLAILAAITACGDDTFETRGCFFISEEQPSCPSRSEVDRGQLSLPDVGCSPHEVLEVLGPPKVEDVSFDYGYPARPACCYRVKAVDRDPDSECTSGRPYYEDGEQLRSPLRFGPQLAPSTASERARAWANAGAAEHASVAAFTRLSLQLMALGAPTHLLRGVHQAALDEIRHTERCFRLAESLGGQHVAAAEFPCGDVEVKQSLTELAAAATREGCLAETLGAHVLGVAAELANEPEVKTALAAITREEASHAVLSFQIVAWALRVGGREVKEAVMAAFAEPWPIIDVAELALRANVDVAELQAAAARGAREVLAPAAARLLA